MISRQKSVSRQYNTVIDRILGRGNKFVPDLTNAAVPSDVSLSAIITELYSEKSSKNTYLGHAVLDAFSNYVEV